MSEQLDKHIPGLTLIFVVRATRRKNRAFRKAKSTKNAIDWEGYKRIKSQTQKDLRIAHKKYMEDVISKDAQEITREGDSDPPSKGASLSPPWGT